MIEFRNVTAGYGEFMILNDLSFEAARGRITLLIGPNGAGKSTLFNLITDLLYAIVDPRVEVEG